MGWSASVRAFSVGGERDLQSAMIKVLGAIGDERLGVGELILELGQRHHAPQDQLRCQHCSSKLQQLALALNH